MTSITGILLTGLPSKPALFQLYPIYVIITATGSPQKYKTLNGDLHLHVYSMTKAVLL